MSRVIVDRVIVDRKAIAYITYAEILHYDSVRSYRWVLIDGAISSAHATLSFIRSFPDLEFCNPVLWMPLYSFENVMEEAMLDIRTTAHTLSDLGMHRSEYSYANA